MKKLLGISLLTLLLAGCEGYRPSQPGMEYPVIEGWIDSDGHPVVMFTTTITPGSDSELEDRMVQWGRVRVTDGHDTVTLVSGISHDYFPPHRYYTIDMTGEPGRTYTVMAEYRSMRATATAVMPAPTPIDSITAAPVEGSDTLRALALHFTAPEDSPAWYYVTVKEPGTGRALPAMLGTVETDEPGAHVTMPVFMPRNRLSTDTYVANPAVGEELTVSLHRVSREVYTFWRGFDDMVMFGNSQFISSADALVSNVSGGYGIWSVRGTSTLNIKVE